MSWACNYELMQFGFAPIENAWPLNAFERDISLCDLFPLKLSAFVLLRVEFFLLHFRNSLSCVVEPFTQEHLSILRFFICRVRPQTLFYEGVGEEAVSESSNFLGGLLN